MVKIKAKQLLSGRITGAFFYLLFSFAVSLAGAAAVIFSLVILSGEEIKLPFEISSAVRIAAGVIFIVFGLFLISLGKNMGEKKVGETVSGKGFYVSVKKSFQFLLYLCVKTLFTLCWAFLYLLPCGVCLSFLIMSLSQGAMEKNVLYSWITGCIALLLSGLFFLFVTFQRYSLWGYYLCQRNGVISSLYKSLEKTDGRSVKIAFFKLSMLGWVLSCVFVFPVVFVLPYYRVCVCLFATGYKEKEDEKKREEIPPAVFRIIRDL
ncbi:MAG: hypothetical protein K5755_02005 [Clostridiales bacterium]|nr:hypothetical protein [Clostridiales bacterium]